MNFSCKLVSTKQKDLKTCSLCHLTSKDLHLYTQPQESKLQEQIPPPQNQKKNFFQQEVFFKIYCGKCFKQIIEHKYFLSEKSYQGEEITRLKQFIETLQKSNKDLLKEVTKNEKLLLLHINPRTEEFIKELKLPETMQIQNCIRNVLEETDELFKDSQIFQDFKNQEQPYFAKQTIYSECLKAIKQNFLDMIEGIHNHLEGEIQKSLEQEEQLKAMKEKLNQDYKNEISLGLIEADAFSNLIEKQSQNKKLVGKQKLLTKVKFIQKMINKELQ